jgi:hypothetical protein
MATDGFDFSRDQQRAAVLSTEARKPPSSTC